jgi:hypothetical protein
MNTYIIYCLIDPRNEFPFYVGSTRIDPHIRLRQHINGQKTSLRSPSIVNQRVEFIQQILKDGKEPVLNILEYASVEKVDEKEEFHYNRLKNNGYALIQDPNYFVSSKRPIKQKSKITHNVI